MRRILVLTCLPVVLILVRALSLSAGETVESGRIIPEITAMRVNPHPPVIDGNLDDSVWQHQELIKVSQFTQIEPDEGVPVTESTFVALAYDDDALYVAFWCYDSEPDKINQKLVRRDRSSEADRVTVRLDCFHDHLNGYAFEVNASGVVRDCRYYNNDNSDMSWDAVWEADVQSQPWGWSAEYKIPYHCLRFTEMPVHTWGADFQRYISRKSETSRWAFVSLAKGGFVSNFGHIVGLEGIHSGNHLEVMPYVVASAETSPKELSNPDGKNYIGDAGFDLKYAISSNLILDATINPDFGQVELDQPVLNLSTYETWFSEKRPFFMEGSDLYDTYFSLFYSRRIGRPPRGSIDDSELAYYNEYPDETTILGAAKLTGKLSSGTSIAFLNSVTAEEKAEYAVLSGWEEDTSWVDGIPQIDMIATDTIFREGVVEPSANYSVFRVTQDIYKNSYIGGMMTVASQDSYHPAVTGGVDWRLETADSYWRLRGQSVFSRIDNRNTGFGMYTMFEKLGGKHWYGNLGIEICDQNLNLNRLGYIGRNDTRGFWYWMQYQTTDDWWIVRNSYNNFNFNSSWNYDGINYSLGSNVNTYVEFINYWSLSYSVSMQAEKYSDLETRGNGLWKWPVYPTVASYITIKTDYRKPIVCSWGGGSGTDRGGGHWYVWGKTAYQPRGNIELGLGISYIKVDDGTRWVWNTYDESAGVIRSVFAELDQETLSLEMSTGLLVHRNFSVQLSAVGLISALNYQNHRYYYGEDDYSEPLADVDSDYNYSAINSTLLLRWEYSPGSSLYIVWTRARDEVASGVKTLVPDRDLDRFFSRGATNVFLVKASYWMNI